MDKAYYILRTKFGHVDFLPSQKKAIEYSIDKFDLLIIAKTSAGKSLCYQLPALCCNGLTIIISPLKSLIDDQINNLKKNNIDSHFLYGNIDRLQKKKLYDSLLKDNFESLILYTTPETLEFNTEFNNILSKLHKKNLINRFVIDEAHTISTWGHEFRNSYLKLSSIRINYPNIPITALTATATPEVKEDIIDILGLKNYKLITQSIIRNNLYIDIKKNYSNLQQKIIEIIKDKYLNKTGIIYCNSKKKCEEVNFVLKKNNLNSNYYHAGMDSYERNKIQSLWKNGDIHIIVATIAFGMGIDKSDVRFVIHYNIPKNIESYYQEIGRAGRDNKKSDCILFFNDNDITQYNSQIKKNISEINNHNELLYLNNQLNKIDQIKSFINNDIDCRQYLLSYYFGTSENIKCLNCDNCFKKDENYYKEDVTHICLNIIKAIKFLDKDADKYKIKKILYSREKNNKIFDSNLYGSCISICNILYDRTFIHLVSNNYISESVKKINNIWFSFITLNNKSKLINKKNNPIYLLSSKNKTTIDDFFKKSFSVDTKCYNG